MATREPAAHRPDDAALPTVELPEGGLQRLAAAFQQGVTVRVPDGTSVSDFLVEVLGVDPGYVRSRISTVFLDGSVVDDVETARLHQGSRLALSAAMPGLVGATLRKGGYYAAMRAAITLAADGPGTTDGSTALVSVKLFNLLIEELGPVLLAHGVALPAAEARALLGERAGEVPAGASEVWLRVPAR
jgi:hypothetical protein